MAGKGMVINKEFEKAVKEMELQEEIKINFQDCIKAEVRNRFQMGLNCEFNFLPFGVILPDIKRISGYVSALMWGNYIDVDEYNRLIAVANRYLK